MASTEFHLVTEWLLDASQEEVWNVLIEPERWPLWWPTVKSVELLDPDTLSRTVEVPSEDSCT